MRSFIIIFSHILSLCIFSSCAGNYRHKLDFNPNESLRVAVVPFSYGKSGGEEVEEDSDIILDEISVVSSKLEDSPGVLLRKTVEKELGKTALDVLSPYLVETELPHYGYAKADGSFDLEAIAAARPKRFCRSFLDCDAVMYGRVTRWERSYYGVQSVQSVGLELKLVSVKDDKVLFTAYAEDSESRGLSKGPTGYSSIVIEPIRGLDSDIIRELTSRVVREALAPLRSENRPGYLDSAPPAVYAAAHDAKSGVLERGETLSIVMFGTENMAASFSIGKAVKKVPMEEVSPGNYFGEYFPLETDRFKDQTLKVSVVDDFGRKTELDVFDPKITLLSEN